MTPRITITTDKYIHYITPSEVLYCECSDTESTFHLLDESTIHIVKEKSVISKIMDAADFLHPHPSFFVNRNHIKQVDIALDDSLTLSNNVKIPASKKSIKAIIKTMKNLDETINIPLKKH